MVVLELGKAGSAGTERGVLPVLRDGSVVATLRASNWKESATAVIGERVWVLAKSKRELTGRWAADPEDAVRLRARQISFWKGTWAVEMDGTPVDMQSTGPGLPLDHSVFPLWVELVLSRRNDAATGAAVGAAVIGGSS